MKIFQVISACSFALFTMSCDQDNELVSLSTKSVMDRSPQFQEPLPDTDFSRGFGINNAGVLAGSVRNEDGVVVAFRMSNHELWMSEEAVLPNGLPELRFAINDRGDIASHKAIPGGMAPAMWDDGVRYDLALLPGYQFGEVFDMNASGQIVGECFNGSVLAPTATRATVFTVGGDAIDLGTLGGTRSAALGINDAGDIVGVAENANGQMHAFLYTDGVMQDLGTLGGTTSNANAINNRGDIAGRSFLANGAIRAFLYSDGVMQDLGTLGGAASVAFDVNDHGDVVGFSRIPNGQARAFLYRDGVMQDLGALGGIDSRAISINNQGDIIGHYTKTDGSVHAFLYRDGEMIALQ